MVQSKKKNMSGTSDKKARTTARGEDEKTSMPKAATKSQPAAAKTESTSSRKAR